MGGLRAPRAPRGARLLLLLALAGAGAACAAPRGAAPLGPIDPTYEPAFAALAAAVDARDDALAERVLATILARGPDEPTRAHADVYGRILRGRALGRELRLTLEAAPDADGATVALALRAEHGLDAPLELRGGAGTLRQLLTGLDAMGTEQRVARSVAVEAVERVRVPPGSATRIALGRYEVPVEGALAVQAEWDLSLPAGSVRSGAQDYPLDSAVIQGCETLRLAPWLPQAQVDPGELARYVASGGRALPAVIERAVRVAPQQREEALDALVPVALELPDIDLAVLVPALRWLSGRRELGADVEGWSRWLEARAAAPPDQGEQAPALDLPATAPGGSATVPDAGAGAQG